MRFTTLALALTAGLGGIASAQPGPPPQPPPPPVDPMGTSTTTTDPAPPDPGLTQPQPQPPPPPPPTPVVTAAPVEQSTADKPEGMSFSIGVGYAIVSSGMSTSLQTPNLTNFRLRLAGGITIEPRLEISNATDESETPAGTQTETKTTVFGLDGLVRIPVISRGKADFEALGVAGFASAKVNPDGDFNTTTGTAFGIGWGLGIGYWVTPHWQISMSVTNPLVTYTQTKQQAGPGMTDKDSRTKFGIEFAPDVALMINLYN